MKNKYKNLGVILTARKEKILVDTEDFKILNKMKWYLDSAGYPITAKRIRMHRFLMKLKTGDKKMVDHINMNKLDNRKSNLRICSRSQNMMNTLARKHNLSGYKGVHYMAARCHEKRKKKWVALISIKGKDISKYCLTKIEAAKKYNEMATRYFGEFAKLNQI